RRQEAMWIAHHTLARGPSHPFYERLNQLLEGNHFDDFVEGLCRRFYAEKQGRPSLAPGIYFRLLLIGYFEGIDSERGIAWRAQDSLALRSFLDIALDESSPDHSTLSRTRRLMDVETHREVFAWVLRILAEQGLLKGRRWRLTPPRWRRTRPCGRSCGGTRGKDIRSSCSGWRWLRGSRRPRGRTWRGWIGNGRTRDRMRNGSIRTIPTRASRR